jgi:hypothetical protein
VIPAEVNLMEDAKDNYIWSYFKNIEDLRKNRLGALKSCTKDMGEFSGRYIPVELASLPL